MQRFSKIVSHYAWTLGAFIVIAMLVIWLVLYLVRDQSTVEESPSHVCRDNIAKLVEAQVKWAEDHGGEFADKFSDLHPDYISSLRTFQCPAVMGEHLFDENRIDELCEYEMAKGLGTDSSGSLIFIYDKEGNHKHSRNVGFVDGTVKEIHEFKFCQMLKKQMGED